MLEKTPPPFFETRIGTDLEEAAWWLKRGEPVGVPTETVYGLAGNALRADAVARIFSVKNRPTFDPLIVHVSGSVGAAAYVGEMPAWARVLAAHFWPGPLTLLLPRREIIPDLVTSGLERVGIRVPAHPLVQELLGRLPFPLAAPSANPFGYISPTQAAHVVDQLGGLIPYVLDGGACRVGLESTVVGWEGEALKIYRPGGIAREAIEAVVGPVGTVAYSGSHPGAPGMLEAHYAPRKRLIVGSIPEQPVVGNPGVLCFGHPGRFHRYRWVEVLSECGNPEEAAQNLFGALRRLDASDASLILAEWLPEAGLGRAVNDRLLRASFRGA
jgi:L-threonylcarbamoyladenylate synthase